MPRYCLKVCGLTRAEDALMCAELGVDWLGFIFHPASPRRVEPGPVAAFETGAARRVGVFVDQSPAEVNHIMAEARLDLAQLHGDQSREFCQAVGPERVIKVFWPQRCASPEELGRGMAGFSEAAAFFLLEAGTSGGGHGRPLDLGRWTGLAPPRPWLLAGGLEAASAGTVAARPPAGLLGFDFNSRVEIAPGLKDRRLVAAAVEAVRENEV
ncbi:MAG: phosphoribosylanthranilate isomerase [Candidatus Adiutrix sp.]|jgi:phosphoribosylanthranilate isomerase|nr:phosphoribosylanthranilate isomerase [Candidatus Adiutrix sp.]